MIIRELITELVKFDMEAEVVVKDENSNETWDIVKINLTHNFEIELGIEKTSD